MPHKFNKNIRKTITYCNPYENTRNSCVYFYSMDFVFNIQMVQYENYVKT